MPAVACQQALLALPPTIPAGGVAETNHRSTSRVEHMERIDGLIAHIQRTWLRRVCPPFDSISPGLCIAFIVPHVTRFCLHTMLAELGAAALGTLTAVLDSYAVEILHRWCKTQAQLICI